MKGTKTLVTTLAIGAALFAAASGYAWMGRPGPGPGYGMMMGMGCDGPMMGGYATGPAASQLTAEQQAQVAAIQKKYADEFNAKRQAIFDKQAELQKALTNDTATVAEINQLRTELFTLQQDLWSLGRKVNAEIAETVGVATGAFMGPGYCWNWDATAAAAAGPNPYCMHGPGYGPRHMMMGSW